VAAILEWPFACGNYGAEQHDKGHNLMGMLLKGLIMSYFDTC
jgi:hypothetical protein